MLAFLFHIYPDVAEHPSNSSLPIPERLGPERAALETALRPCSQICARIAQLGHGDNGTRSKFMGVCRHFTLLASAILRHLKVPARSRVGFAGYFSKQWEDHWILEAWDPSAENWRSIDPQLDPLLLSKLNTDREFKIDPINLPRGLASRGFATGTEAYLGCTDGGYNANEFGIENVRGLFFIEGDAVLDFLALSKVRPTFHRAIPTIH